MAVELHTVYAAVTLLSGEEVTPRVECRVGIRLSENRILPKFEEDLKFPPVSKGGVGSVTFFSSPEGPEWKFCHPRQLSLGLNDLVTLERS